MKDRKLINPLIRRIPKELLGDWRKYLVVFLFLVLSIGFISGMYVANASMVQASDSGVTKYKLEDGHFELEKMADSNLIAAIETGDRADIKQYYIDKAKRELDERFADEFRSSFDLEFKRSFDSKFDLEFESQIIQTLKQKGLDDGTAKQMAPEAIAQAKSDGTYKSAYDKAYNNAYGPAYQTAYDEAYSKAWNEIQAEIDEKYAEAEDDYDLNNADFKPEPVKVYENFNKTCDEDNNNDGKADGTIRVYSKTKEINLASVIEGRLPRSAKEIAIDRMHADNAGIKVGDNITISGEVFKVVGLIAYVNYSTLHEKNSDLIFDALKFDVGMVTDEGFNRINEKTIYTYAWRYKSAPQAENEQKSVAENFMRALLTQIVVADNEIKDFLPRYANQAVNFARDDMGSDMAMGGVLLYILIVIIAFIFAITINNTIVKESSTIGTLRASGYTRGELISHYISMPVIVTLISAIVGNIFGYTVCKNLVVSMYYNSYSLPKFETVWSGNAFVKTTLIPVALMFIINLAVISVMLHHSPLSFLRHDLRRKGRKKAMKLPEIGFIRRFRLRIIFQNASNYLIMLAGIVFISIMLAMAVGMPTTLDYYKENVSDMLFSRYQYVLTGEDNEESADIVRANYREAEKFDMTDLVRKGESLNEDVSVYGISKNSRYVEIGELDSLECDEVYISKPYASKYKLAVGDSIQLDEKYEKKKYTFNVAGIYDKCPSIAVFMPIENYEEIFEIDAGEFTGFFSDTRLSKIPESSIVTVITKRDITKMCDQMQHSMGSYMTYFQYLCILLSTVLIYLLSKIVIEKNETSISMTKILGYDNKEIAGLYILSTTIVVVIETAIAVVIGGFVMWYVWKLVMRGYSGWFEFVIKPTGYIKMFAFILIGYIIVTLSDFKRIRRIPMDEALKNME